MWDLPGSGTELVSPALAGGFFTIEPPGKPIDWCFFYLGDIGAMSGDVGCHR